LQWDTISLKIVWQLLLADKVVLLRSDRLG
jgi:hypothetical protein